MGHSFLKKRFLFLLLLLPAIHWSQNITGKVVDNENNPLEFAAVAVLNPADTTLISYANTNKIGKFKLTEISKGNKIFQVHLVGFKTYQTTIDFKSKSIDMRIIKLEDINILEEVIVNAEVPISIKKDTIIYNASAFKVSIDDNVEDLLKKLPGIEIDAAGKITAHGEEVKIVYVDGKDFFSGDPSIASKNISANAIKKVAVIDEKSERSRLTGLNDTERKKVINLELKDANKVNAFGKFHGGYGSDDRYLTSLNYNRFSPKLQVSVIGMYNNVNSFGSDISEIMTFGGKGTMPSLGYESSNYGFLTTGVGGLNLGYELKKDKNLNTDYFYNYTNTLSGDVVTVRTEFINNNEILSESKSNSEGASNNHSLNFSYRNRSNKLSTLHIGGRVNNSINTGSSINSLDKYNVVNELDLQSNNTINSERTNSSGTISMQYFKRFNEKNKRNFSISAKINSSTNNSVSNNDQLNKFSISDPNNFFESKQEIKRAQDFKRTGIGFNFNYTEPLGDHHYLELKAGIDYKFTDDKVDQSKYENDNVQPPLHYKLHFKNTDKRGGLFYKYDSEKLTFDAGAIVVDQALNFGFENQEEFKNVYSNINPEINIRIHPKRGKYMNINLSKSIRIPSLYQLYPIINDYNPLYIRNGNPDLIPENNYSVSGKYINQNFTTGFNFFSLLSYNYTTNTIANSEFTDDLGIRTSTYVNSGNRDNLNINFNMGKRVKSLGLRFNVILSGGYRNYLSIINDETNETNSKNGTFGFSVENNNKEKIDASAGASWGANQTNFTAGNNANRDYLQQSYFTKINWNITERLNFNNQFKYDLYTDSNFGTDQSVPIWNASISYSFLKSKSMNVMLSAVDILNKNIGIERNSSDNYFEESHREVLGKYYMLSLTYNLNNK